MVLPLVGAGLAFGADQLFNKGRGTKAAGKLGNKALGTAGDLSGFGVDPRRLERDAMAKYADMAQRYEDIGLPSLAQLSPSFKYVGHNQNPFTDLASDSASTEAQFKALQGLQEMSQQGFTPAERGMMDAAQRQAAQAEKAQRMAVLQQMAARGMTNSGAALSGALAAQQGGANRLADQQAQLQMGAQQRALGALQSSGSLSSNMRQQADNMSRFRASALDQFNQRNTDRYNQNQKDHSAAVQQNFANKMNRLGAIGNIYGTQAGYMRDQANQARKRQKGTIDGLVKTGTSIAKMAAGGG